MLLKQSQTFRVAIVTVIEMDVDALAQDDYGFVDRAVAVDILCGTAKPEVGLRKTTRKHQSDVTSTSLWRIVMPRQNAHSMTCTFHRQHETAKERHVAPKRAVVINAYFHWRNHASHLGHRFVQSNSS